MKGSQIRNLAIIAHVDHGKTTLVDALLTQSGVFRDGEAIPTCILDSNDLERERGITILSKNTAVDYKGVRINIVDTPGHADFGGEVERVLGMVDGCLLIVDANEGPMPQTRFVLKKALEKGLRPIVFVNKIDRARVEPEQALDKVLDLFLELGADDDQCDFPYLFGSGMGGYAKAEMATESSSMEPLFEAILRHVPAPVGDPAKPLQMQVTTLDYNDFLGRIIIGRVHNGTIKNGQPVALIRDDGTIKRGKVTKLLGFQGLRRIEIEEARAGDIAAVAGFDEVNIGETVACPDHPEALPLIKVDEPTLQMTFMVNDSPFAGKEGKFVTSRQVRDRLQRELLTNVALRFEDTDSPDRWLISGRGELHLGILIETMRREGYEFSVGKPTVVLREVGGKLHEPYETLNVEVPEDKVGPVMELVGARRGILDEMLPRGTYSLLQFEIPARGLIGLRTRLLNATQGTAIIHHRYSGYRPKEGDVPNRANGVLVSMVTGKAVGFALFGLQDRSELFVAPGDEVYEGMIVGENARDNDLTVNPCREKKLTNIRAAGSDENIILKPPRQLFLEAALEYIEEDELVEITPKSIRLRKISLRESERRRQTRAAAR